MEYIYGALLLHKLGKPVDEMHLKKVIESTGAQVDESKIKALIASLNGIDITAELENAQIAVAMPGSSGSQSATAKEEEKREEKKQEESAAGLASLFG